VVGNKIKTSLLILSILFLASTAYSLSLDVHIGEITQYDTVQIQKMDDVEHRQEVNFTLENTGSIGCTFQAGLETEIDGEENVAWSEPVQLWPGDSTFMQINDVYQNKTSTANATLFLDYCYQTDELENFQYEIDAPLDDENNQTSSEIETSTLTSSETQANISSDLEEAILVPKDSPSMWRTSSATIENGQSTLNYDTQIFDENQVLTYYVLQDGELLGETQVQLAPETGIVGTIQENIVGIILVLSVVLNVLFITQKEPKKLLNTIKPLNRK